MTLAVSECVGVWYTYQEVRKNRRLAMDIPVLVEPVANNGFRAATGEPLHLETRAPTREEAIRKLRELIERRVAAGAELVSVSVDTSAHPLAAFAGRLKDDPLVEPWKQAMADYRTKRDASPDTP
jgi:hypothetical protein